jgi:hypothetical protein
MKMTPLTSAFVAALGIALASAPVTVSAQTSTAAPAATTAPAATPAPSSKEKHDYVKYEGTIMAMDATSVTIQTSSGTMTLMVNESTKIQVNHKKAAMTDFKVGDKVTGSYEKMADGTMMAHSLRKKQTAKATSA